MKKSLSLVLIALLVVGAAIAFTGCSSSSGDVKLGFASKTTMSMSADLAEKDGVKSGKTLSDTMMVSVIVDKAGKVQKIHIDTVQAPITFDETGKITVDKATTVFQSKRELGDKYGMKKASKIGKEWYEQADAIEKWMTGKTADQIKNMKVKATESEGNVADEADLSSSATIGISEFIEVAVAAINNAK